MYMYGSLRYTRVLIVAEHEVNIFFFPDFHLDFVTFTKIQKPGPNSGLTISRHIARERHLSGEHGGRDPKVSHRITVWTVPDVRTGSWMGPPPEKRASRVGPLSIVILAREKTIKD